MTKNEAAIVTAYTGVLCGSFESFQVYVEALLGRPVWTHEFADAALANEIRILSRPDFLALRIDE